LENWRSEPVRFAWNRSAAKTPNWQVTEERTKTVVFIVANLMLSMPVFSAQNFGPWTARVVKYIANNAAKNISSLESQTIVPTATKFGLLTFTGLPEAWVAVVMWAIIPDLPAKV
jgi:hypothetical protein